MRGFTMLLWGFAVVCAAHGLPPQKIHEQMTPIERMQTFQTMDNFVGDYEITAIHWPKVQKRSADGRLGLWMRAFGSDIKLWLEPTEGILAGHDTPIYRLNSGPLGPNLTEYSEVMETVQAYEDLKNSAALVVRQRRDNSRAVIGTIGSENLVITPIPERLLEEVKRQRRSVDQIPESEQDDHHYHIVYKRSAREVNEDHPELPLPNVALAQTAAGQVPPIPDIVYPELLIVVDYALYSTLGKDFWYTAAYMLAFWNSVDLKYRYFENPKFRLNIAGIVLAEDAQALDYMATNAWNATVVKGTSALRESGTYWWARKEDIPLDAYDVIVTMTSNELCSFYVGDPECHTGTLGTALLGAACKRHDYYKELYNVVILTDRGGFDGIHTAAHELAHSFGAMHDDSNKPNCSPQDGKIMSSVRRINDSPTEWSECSANDIRKFLESNPSCLYNRPNHRAPLPRYLPGKLLNADKQCQKAKGTKACKKDASICRSLSCTHPTYETYCLRSDIAAADGTECGTGKMCLNGRCITEPAL
ncbi:A disintegrin and metalloproteinase with thrombospondin motifs like [Diachasmimorpha longicaudata]|uniref:A disintegrin and metalloproteinase with thrombospondin motifs like n=1 Tax=Diachasmimorpha longicaudata TaxID=58733 RepID=UPI0030B8845C